MYIKIQFPTYCMPWRSFGIRWLRDLSKNFPMTRHATCCCYSVKRRDRWKSWLPISFIFPLDRKVAEGRGFSTNDSNTNKKISEEKEITISLSHHNARSIYVRTYFNFFFFISIVSVCKWSGRVLFVDRPTLVILNRVTQSELKIQNR